MAFLSGNYNGSFSIRGVHIYLKGSLVTCGGRNSAMIAKAEIPTLGK